MKVPALPDPWWRIIGPWPFRPALLGPVMAIYLSGLRNSQRISEGNVFDLEWLTEGTFVAVLMAVPFTLVLYLGVLWQRRFGVKPAAYIAFHVLAVTVVVAERFLVGDVTTDVLTDAPTIVTAILRISVVVFIFSLAGPDPDVAVAAASVRAIANNLPASRVGSGRVILDISDFARAGGAVSVPRAAGLLVAFVPFAAALAAGSSLVFPCLPR